MLTEYIRHAMRHAHYELMENGRFYASIAPCPGVWAEGATLEECRTELEGALESWIVVGLRHGDTLPVIDGMDLNPREYAEPHQVA
ncbi:MAG: type II toxin-antitoxin system HicB family antitoxin [Verrucomicrobiae bacterium]|nr:type II toxin-antitoxin system HicB family antitoxin [Verrucomicrobiae bacterium]